MNVQNHFDSIASSYRTIRYTDTACIEAITPFLNNRQTLKGIEVGCGSGRYSLLLMNALPKLDLTCVDISRGMLAELKKQAECAGFGNIKTIYSPIEDISLLPGIFDAVFTFNAIHHFDLDVFLKKAAMMLREKGYCFIYTRFQSQNAESIWGEYFPMFLEKEDRLLTRNNLSKAVKKTKDLTIKLTLEFQFERKATLSQLLKRADLGHYSTFKLYSKAEFIKAKEQFTCQLKNRFRNP